MNDDSLLPTDDSPPSEAWLFAQAILGKPVPRIARPEVKARAKREGLERLAQYSTRHAEELRRLRAAEVEARHDRELLEWAAQISTEAADKLAPCSERKRSNAKVGAERSSSRKCCSKVDRRRAHRNGAWSETTSLISQGSSNGIPINLGSPREHLWAGNGRRRAEEAVPGQQRARAADSPEVPNSFPQIHRIRRAGTSRPMRRVNGLVRRETAPFV